MSSRTVAAPHGAREKPLAAYNRKRRFNLTPEPRGTWAASAEGDPRFVVQQHHASVMHFDFRLEIAGVLVSWAVPKGPSLSTADKRLAVQTEDHPLSYADFEGSIPKGEYGGGHVIVWDHGSWTADGDARAGLENGHLSFVLHGEKLRGRFGLIRTRGKVTQGPRSTWLLMKKDDEFADRTATQSIVQREPHSVLSGQSVAQLRQGPKPTRAKAHPRRKLPEDIEIQLASPALSAPEKRDWLYEVKFDGYRIQVRLEGGTVSMQSRNGLDWTKQFPILADRLNSLQTDGTVLDGELCFMTPEGKSSFQDLQRSLPRGSGKPDARDQQRLVIYFFDLLFLDGDDLRAEPLFRRKQLLKKLLSTKGISSSTGPLRYSDHVEGEGRLAFTQACVAGLEGLIGKRRNSPYRAGRGGDWIKLKCHRRQEFVIVGYTRPQGARSGFGALLLATREGSTWKYRGKVGTGFDDTSLRELSKLLKARTTETTVLDKPPRLPGVFWVKPDLLCEVRYAELTRDGVLRHASFQGLRLDKPGTAVSLDRPQAAKRARGRADVDDGQLTEDEHTVQGVAITHPERVVDARSGLSKGALARYYAQVSALLLPYASNRPLALVRCPQGNAQQCFFQKHKTAGFGASVHQRRVSGQDIVFIDDATGLLQLVQFNVIELHGWGSTLNHPSKPSWIVMDLDPDIVLPFSAVIDAALEVREAFASMGLKSWVKTTGGKGLHVIIPIEAREGWQAVKNFSHAVADAFASRAPDRYVATSSKAKRAGRIFIDYLRNGEGATAVLPYSVRARPGSTVAVPVAWQDLPHLDPQEFSVSTSKTWLKPRRKDPWLQLLHCAQGLPDWDVQPGASRKRQRL